jgi:hypothetical protein
MYVCIHTYIYVSIASFSSVCACNVTYIFTFVWSVIKRRTCMHAMHPRPCPNTHIHLHMLHTPNHFISTCVCIPHVYVCVVSRTRIHVYMSQKISQHLHVHMTKKTPHLFFSACCRPSITWLSTASGLALTRCLSSPSSA